MRRLLLAFASLLMLSACGGDIDFNDHSGLAPPPGWTPHPDYGKSR